MAMNYDLFLQGPVGGWDFDASYVDYVLDKFNDREVKVLIDSLGGLTDTALSICSAFVDHGNVSVHFRGMNASAATIASMGAKKITIEDSATYLVHKCSLEFFDWSMKNADQLESYIEQLKAHKENLDKIDSHIAELYARRCKKNPSDLLALMKKGGWLTPQEAKDWGFVDEVVSGKEKKPLHISSVMASAISEAGIPLPPGVTVEDAVSESFVKNVIDKISNFFKSSKMDPSKQNQTDQPENESPEPQNQSQQQSAKSEIEKLREEFEAEKKAHADKEAALNARIAELEKQPASSSSQVVESTKSSNQEPENQMIKSFAETSVSAKKLFDSLPL